MKNVPVKVHLTFRTFLCIAIAPAQISHAQVVIGQLETERPTGLQRRPNTGSEASENKKRMDELRRIEKLEGNQEQILRKLYKMEEQENKISRERANKYNPRDDDRQFDMLPRPPGNRPSVPPPPPPPPPPSTK